MKWSLMFQQGFSKFLCYFFIASDSVIFNDNPSEYTEIPLKSEETAQIFSFMNETCKNQFGKGIHDMMKEFRKGKKRFEKVCAYEK